MHNSTILSIYMCKCEEIGLRWLKKIGFSIIRKRFNFENQLKIGLEQFRTCSPKTKPFCQSSKH